VDFVGRKPQTWQFVLGANRRRLTVEPPASALTVEYDRRVHAVTQVRDLAFDSGCGSAEFLDQELPRQAAPGIEKTLQPVQPFGL
jgi:hypothetical protein